MKKKMRQLGSLLLVFIMVFSTIASPLARAITLDEVTLNGEPTVEDLVEGENTPPNVDYAAGEASPTPTVGDETSTETPPPITNTPPASTDRKSTRLNSSHT